MADTYNASIRQITPEGSVSTQPPLIRIPLPNPHGDPQPTPFYSLFSFTAPQSIAVDNSTNLYVSDNNGVYQASYQIAAHINGMPYAVVIDLADTSFNQPFGIGLDTSSNLYVADFGNDVIREITQTGLVTSVAGVIGVAGETNGIGTNALFSSPYGIAIDAANTVYVTDFAGGIRKVTESNVVSSFWSQQGFPVPHAIAVDHIGNVYVVAGNTNQSNNVVKISPLGTSLLLGILPFFGETPPGIQGTTGVISGIAVDDDDNIYLSDQLHSVILKGTPSYPPFFNGQAALSGGADYLAFTNGTVFGYYNLGSFNFPFFYHYDLGFEYFSDASDGHGGAYLYDFTSGAFWYTSPQTFPYLYDFSLGAWLYYYPDSIPGHYTSNPRYFYNFATSQIITR